MRVTGIMGVDALELDTRDGLESSHVATMNAVAEIEKEIESLPREDFMRLRDSMQRHFEDDWDREFKQDAAAGRLDALAEGALAEHRAGRSTPFPPHEEPGRP